MQPLLLTDVQTLLSKTVMAHYFLTAKGKKRDTDAFLHSTVEFLNALQIVYKDDKINEDMTDMLKIIINGLIRDGKLKFIK